MRHALWIPFVLSVLIPASALAHEGHSFCATPLFQEARIALSEQFDRSAHQSLAPAARAKPAVGDTMTFWAWDLTVMPPVWIQVPATCRAVGRYCYVCVADDQWNVNMDQADVDLVEEKFDHSTPGDPTRGIYELDTETFGPAPDELDNDPKIYIFYSALGCFGSSCFDGYFSVFNEYTEEEAQQQGGHSNEVEMFYMSCDPINPTANSTLSVLAHEFQHMIHWNMDPDEATWVDEGCAEYAMYLYGYPDPITGFPSNPDDNLIVWDQQWSDYIQTYLWTMYLAEHFGGSATITALVAEAANSIDGVENTLAGQGYSETFEEVFVDWTIANFLDDTSVGEGQYGYAWIDLPPFSASSQHNNYPVPSTQATVQDWAADYVRFIDGAPMTLSYNGRNNSFFSVPLLKIDDVAATMVEYTVLDSLQDGTFPLPNFGIGYDTLIMVSSHISSEGGDLYTYWTEELTEVASDFGPASGLTSPVLFQNQPNPFNPVTKIAFALPTRGHVRLEVYDVTGELVAELVNAEVEAGYRSVVWDGSDRSGVPVAPGVYFSRMEAGGKVLSRKMVLVK
ncbi:MAG: hypothetical protein KAW17_12005 [Candidatus Eisenbacteria sp.]|nr:hypothetical protein [Candidatus Eisenbacteria bacterium]